MPPSSIDSTHTLSTIPHTLFALPRNLLQHSLLYLEAADVRNLSQTNSGRQYDALSTPSSSSSSSSSTLSSFFTRLMTLLEDRSHLLRESAIRLRRFEQQGYKRGLDAMNEKVDAEGLLQKPFTTGFLKGAKKGWNEMVLKGMIASLACFTFKHERHLLEQQNTEGSETKELVQHIIKINNDINESLVVLPLSKSVSSSTSSSLIGAPRVAISTVLNEEEEPSTSSQKKCGQGCACATEKENSQKAESKCNSVNGECACAASSSSSTSSCASKANDDMPPLESASLSSSSPSTPATLASASPLQAWQALRSSFEHIGIDISAAERYVHLPNNTNTAPVTASNTTTGASSSSTASSSSSPSLTDVDEDDSPRPVKVSSKPVRRSTPPQPAPSLQEAQMAALDW